MITIGNKKNTIEFSFNEYAPYFGTSKFSIDKGSGNRLYLSEKQDYIEVIYSADGEKIVINTGQYAFFQSIGGLVFANSVALYTYLAACMEDREGIV
jgi:hypothetical protein